MNAKVTKSHEYRIIYYNNLGFVLYDMQGRVMSTKRAYRFMKSYLMYKGCEELMKVACSRNFYKIMSVVNPVQYVATDILLRKGLSSCTGELKYKKYIKSLEIRLNNQFDSYVILSGFDIIVGGNE